MNKRTRLALVTTGGTIAGVATDLSGPDGYTAGVLTGDALVNAAPGIAGIADIRIEPCLALDSKDMQPAHWQLIARTAADLLENDDVDGLVITHGTDTLEETALFLDLVLHAGKPVVITGAMRPATALSADGPANLRDAVRVAAHPDSCGRGVLIAFGERILPARGMSKTHATRLDAFSASDGPVGASQPAVRYFHPPALRPPLFALPDATLTEVAILHVAAGNTPALAEAAVSLGARGLVLALTGNGSVPQAWESIIETIIGQGVPVVRASRCGESYIGPRQPDTMLGTWPAGILSPVGARVALMLALSNGRSIAEAEALFRHIAGLPDGGTPQS